MTQRAITVRLSEFVRALKVAGLYAAEDCPLTSIRHVCLEAGGGVFTATSTNRYVAAHARGTADGTMPPVWIRRDYAESLVQILEPLGQNHSHNALVQSDAFNEVNIVMTGERVMTVFTKDGLRLLNLSVKIAEDWTGDQAWPFADPTQVDATFRTVTDYDSARLEGVCQINLEYLAPLYQLLTDGESGCVLRFSFIGPEAAIKVEHADWLTLAVMPVKRRPEHRPEDSIIPVGLPMVTA
jgi:hypothetical protein